MSGRTLTPGEIALATSIYGNLIDYSKVQIFDEKWKFFMPNDRAHAPDGNIYFPSGYNADFSLADLFDRATFIHEMGHVLQHQSGHNVWLEAAANRSYEYSSIFSGTNFYSLGLEQQAQFISDYYLLLEGHSLPGRPDISVYEEVMPDEIKEAAEHSLDADIFNLDNPYCFTAGTLIDMWPTDASIRPDVNGLYDKAEVLAKVWQKPIEDISPTDWVVSFDKTGNLQPGKVTRTFTNQAKIILDFFGTGVTPGHAYYRPDSKKAYKFEPLIDILRDDGVVQDAEGKLIRAATGCEVGSEDDRAFWAFTVYEDKDGNERVRDKKKLRLGTRWMLPDGRHFSMRDYMQGIGMELLPDGYVRLKRSGLTTLFVWTFSDSLPNPEDFVLARSGTTLEDIYKAAEWEGIRPHMPPPMVRDGGPVQPLPQAGLTLMARNTPLAMRDEAYAASSGPMLNRKQRKAAEANDRQQAKAKKRTVH